MPERRLIRNTDVVAAFPWPEDCPVQGGANGVVFSRDRSRKTYKTAFVEASPPGTFLRGEGETVAEAEAACWKQYLVYAGCEHTTFERRQYTNGSGFCVACGTWMSRVFPPLPEDANREPSELEKMLTEEDAALQGLARYSLVKDGYEDPVDELRELDERQD